MAILVTGCSGFIGSEVAKVLLSRGGAVVGADCVRAPRFPAWRLAQLQQFPTFRFVWADISDRNSCESLFQQDSFETVVHFAGKPGVRCSVRDPWSYIEVNVVGTLNVLEMCHRHGVKKLVFASTSSVYGEGAIPSCEDGQTDRSFSPYAASKKSAENLVYVYHYLYNIDATVLRYFTVYGPAMRADMSVLKFIYCIMEDLPVPIYGDGMQKRDYTYIDDIVRGTIAALVPLGFEVINLGSSQPVEVNRVVQLIEKYLNKKARVVHEEQHMADPRVSYANVTKAANILDWEPSVGIEEGVQNTVRWYLDNRTWVKDVMV